METESFCCSYSKKHKKKEEKSERENETECDIFGGDGGPLGDLDVYHTEKSKRNKEKLGSGTTAVLLGGLMMWGLQPGPRLFTDSDPNDYGSLQVS